MTTSVRDGHAATVLPGSAERAPDAQSRQESGDVTVTVATWGVGMDAVRTEPVPDLRPVIEAAFDEIVQRIERRRREPQPPLPDLPSANGVAARLMKT